MTIHPKYIRFFRYSFVGGSTLLFDLALLFFFIDFFSWNATLAAGVSFLIAVSVNYYISRKWVFTGSNKSQVSVATGFFLIALMGLGIVTLGMYIFTTIFAFHYLLSRLFVSALTGFWNYLINLYLNFKVAGEKMIAFKKP